MWARRLTQAVQRRLHQNDEREFNEASIQVTNNRNYAAAAATAPSQTGDEHRSLPLLYNLCRRWAWPAVEFRCQSHPQEADARDHNGDTALHWVVFGNPPVAAIVALLEACPHLASIPNREGRLPLHLAASYRASAGVIRALVNAYPEAAFTPMPNTGALVLHVMCDIGTTVDGIRAIVEANTDALQVCDRVFRRTPLQILNARKSMSRHHSQVLMVREIRNHQERLRRDMHTNRAVAESNLIRLEEQAKEVRQWDFWVKASLLIQAEYKGSPLDGSEDPALRIVHACTGIQGCPLSLLEFASLLYPEQLLEQDEDGEVPLHKAARNCENDNLHDVFVACPEAANVCDNKGKYPLHAAIEAGRCWKAGVNIIVEANPVAMEGFDVDSRLYPRLWSNLAGVNALFRSIKAKPDLFSIKGE